MAPPKTRVSMPAEARHGDIIAIRTLIRHRMETGYRVDSVGRSIPRDIVTKMTVTYAGIEVFAMHFTQGVAANPFIAFHTRAIETGELVFMWQDAKGPLATVRKALMVSP